MIVGLLMLVSGAFAGAFGALLGLGGGVLLVPLLTLGFGRPLRESVAVALVCVIVTSSAASGAHIQRRTANLRLGLLLALFTAVGSLVGGLIAFLIPERLLAALFALLLVYVCVTMARGARRPPGEADPGRSETGRSGSLPQELPDTSLAGRISGPEYRVRRIGPGSAASVGSGLLSALLGVGGGVINVPTMHVLMGVPLRVATATSNLVVGVTAIASAIIYLVRGEIDPYVAGPTALGVFVGATVGSRSAHRVDVRVLRALFVIVLGYTAFQMALRALAS